MKIIAFARVEPTRTKLDRNSSDSSDSESSGGMDDDCSREVVSLGRMRARRLTSLAPYTMIVRHRRLRHRLRL